MKNKILQYLLILSLHFIVIQKANALEQFNFDVTNIEILENGKIFKGLNKGVIKTDDGLIIEADKFEYNKPLNIFKWLKKNNIEDKEMLRTFNCGVGFCLITNPKNLKKIKKFFSKEYKPYIIGKIIRGKEKVKLNGYIDWS